MRRAPPIQGLAGTYRPLAQIAGRDGWLLGTCLPVMLRRSFAVAGDLPGLRARRSCRFKNHESLAADPVEVGRRKR